MTTDEQLADFCADCYDSPLDFVIGAYEWPINGEPGPDVWQRELLEQIGDEVRGRAFNGVDPVMPLRIAVSKGHGVGGSTLIAWLVDWIMSTRPNAHGTITANTNDQLETKTWAAIREWTARCLTAHWFEINSAIMYRKGARFSWFCTPASCAEENSEAFAGQHAKDSTSFYFNDEDSAVPDKIHEVEEGGLTDGEPMQFLFGNPTRNTGRFYEAVFGKLRDRYVTRVIDSRTCKFRNDALISEWQEDYGEDSDFFRVRVRGLPPQASELQFIDGERIAAAQGRHVVPFSDEPLIAGVDVSGGGSAWTVARFRRGADGRSLAPIRISGERTRDREYVISVLAEALNQGAYGGGAAPIAMMFIDSAFGSPIVERLHVMGFANVVEVNFGGESRDPHDGNTRAMMWRLMKEWLLTGGIPKGDVRLATDLAGPGYHLNKKNQLLLEAKESMQKRGLASPDDGDALALTFAMPVKLPARLRTNWGRESAAYVG